jgi:hypothetical protein
MSTIKAYVYKIIYIGNININITYIGSTMSTLRKRFYSHKIKFNEWKEGKRTKCSIFSYFEKYGIKNFKIFLIKEYDVIDKFHLRAYEQLWMNKIKCINEIKSFQILVKERNKQNKQKYYQNKKEEFKDKSNIYYYSNLDKIKKNRSEKINCICGSIISKCNYSQHKKSKKHIMSLS